MRTQFRGDEGANAVEFALVLPILVVLIFGAMYGGIALNHDLSLSTAAREGARYAATLEGVNDAAAGGTPVVAWYTSVLDRVTGEAATSLSAAEPSSEICVAFISETGNARVVRRTWATGAPVDSAKTSGQCYSDGLTNQARVQVTTQRRVNWNAVLVHFTPLIGSDATARYEKELT